MFILETKDSQNSGGKKKKNKKKKGANSDNQTTLKSAHSGVLGNTTAAEESARIVHNPTTNMVTIRNPAFGPPKIEPMQQAAIIKVIIKENFIYSFKSPLQTNRKDFPGNIVNDLM